MLNALMKMLARPKNALARRPKCAASPTLDVLMKKPPHKTLPRLQNGLARPATLGTLVTLARPRSPPPPTTSRPARWSSAPRAVNQPGSELEQPYWPIGHRPERRVTIGIAAAAKPGGEQDEPEQRASVTATGKPGAELEQRVAIAAADEPEERARELIKPEQHVPGGEQAESEQRVAIAATDEPEQRAREQIQPKQHAPGGEQDEPERRVANAAAAEPGNAPFEPEQHAAANEPEQRVAITIAAEPAARRSSRSSTPPPMSRRRL